MTPIKPGPKGSAAGASHKPMRAMAGPHRDRSDQLERSFDALEWQHGKPLAESLRGVITDTKMVDGKE